jgi:hypothetical protein
MLVAMQTPKHFSDVGFSGQFIAARSLLRSAAVLLQ